MNVDRHERGWPGHFVAAQRCLFRRCTELDNGNGRALRVSTVGGYLPGGTKEYHEVGDDRHFETMVFLLDADGDVSSWIELAVWGIGNEPDMADALHETAVQKMTAFIESASDQEWNKFIAWNEERITW